MINGQSETSYVHLCNSCEVKRIHKVLAVILLAPERSRTVMVSDNDTAAVDENQAKKVLRENALLPPFILFSHMSAERLCTFCSVYQYLNGKSLIRTVSKCHTGQQGNFPQNKMK